MPFCANCGAEVGVEAPYCPKCGFRGAMATRPPGLPAGPGALPVLTRGPRLHLRRLSWGLVLLAAWMGLLAWAGIGNTFFPTPPSEPVYLVDMPAPLLAMNAVILLLPVLCLFLLGLGLLGLRTSVPEVRDRLSWRLGPLILGPLRLIGLLILAAILAVVVSLGLYFAAFQSGGTAVPSASLFSDAAFEALFIAMGWCLMVFPAKAIGPWATRRESGALMIAVFLISAAALFEAAMQFVAAWVGASLLAANPDASVPPAYPWADGFSALGAVLGLVVIAWVARRMVHRLSRAAVPSAPLPA